MSEPKDINTPVTATPAVLPTEGEILHHLITQYQKQIEKITKDTEASLTELKTKLAQTQGNMISLNAQRTLLETLQKDFNTLKAS